MGHKRHGLKKMGVNNFAHNFGKGFVQGGLITADVIEKSKIPVVSQMAGAEKSLYAAAGAVGSKKPGKRYTKNRKLEF